MDLPRIWLPLLLAVLFADISACGRQGGLTVEQQAATIVAASATAAATSTPVPASATPVPSPTSTPTEVPTSTPTAFAGGGRIAFVSDRTGRGDIYVIKPDGSEISQLSDTSVSEFLPAWSPQGDRLAYVRYNWEQAATSGIFVMNADGSGSFSVAALATWPTWSPDGQSIAFAYSRCLYLSCYEGGKFLDIPTDIRVVSAQGGGSRLITGSSQYHWNPAWSPDGRWIAATIMLGSWPTENLEIYLIDAESGLTTRLTQSPGNDMEPAWSPDGTRLAFVSNRGGNFDIYLMSTDGQNAIQVTDHVADDHHPTWSPDGRWLAFSSARDGNPNLYLLEIESGNLIRLTDDPAGDMEPDWSRN